MKNLFLIIIFFSSVAWCEDSIIPIPRSDLKFDQDDILLKKPTHPGFELNMSSMSPRNFSENSYLPETSSFRSSSSQISFNFWSTGWTFQENFQISPKAGVSYGQIERQGLLHISEQSVNLTETINLYSLRAGAELKYQGGNYFHPYLGLFLLPTWSQSASSEFNGGESHIYFSYEATAGLALNLPALARLAGVEYFSFIVGLEDREGINGSPLSGTGLAFGTQVQF